MRRSTIARSAGLRISARIASAPLAQVTTSKPAFAARRSTTFSTGISSSTTRSSGRETAGIAGHHRGDLADHSVVGGPRNVPAAATRYGSQNRALTPREVCGYGSHSVRM